MFQFELPLPLQNALPTEERNIRRDEVGLMVSNISSDEFNHAIFNQLPDFLRPGDLLVVNNSGTLKAGLHGLLPDGSPVTIHLSTRLSSREWIIELRQTKDGRNQRFHQAGTGIKINLINGGHILLGKPYYRMEQTGHLKLWNATLVMPETVEQYLHHYGQPIRYSYVQKAYPQRYYQTIFASEMGSAEMPSAGRAFTPRLVVELIKKGIAIAPLTLHTGVASLEIDERPYEEFYRVPQATTSLINLTRREGGRVIAIGTTVVRALESVTTEAGKTSPGEGWTDVFITPERGIFGVDAMLTGFHEPRASHLLMLEALAGRRHLRKVYSEALAHQYHWHEFGDLHLILP